MANPVPLTYSTPHHISLNMVIENESFTSSTTKTDEIAQGYFISEDAYKWLQSSANRNCIMGGAVVLCAVTGIVYHLTIGKSDWQAAAFGIASLIGTGSYYLGIGLGTHMSLDRSVKLISAKNS